MKLTITRADDTAQATAHILGGVWYIFWRNKALGTLILSVLLGGGYAGMNALTGREQELAQQVATLTVENKLLREKDDALRQVRRNMRATIDSLRTIIIQQY